MKKVWVNRFNHDGSLKPMDEWELKECLEWDDFYTQSGDVFYFCKKSSRRWTQEELNVGDLSSQRGDGWFYVADGDLPPEDNEDLMVMAWDADGAEKVAIIKITTLIYHYNRCLKYGRAFTYPCWQPITPPKFL